MTFTPTYIQMMSKSPVQKEWKPKVGDWIFHKHYNVVNLLPEIYSKYQYRKLCVWLPLEGDWWEMIEQFYIKNDSAFRICLNKQEILQGRFYHYIQDIFYLYKEKPTRLELLSAFVHERRWGVRWSREKWRKG